MESGMGGSCEIKASEAVLGHTDVTSTLLGCG